jgi:multicomponent Na+:H+ antiporter subunit F
LNEQGEVLMPGTAFAVFSAILLLCCALCLFRIGRGPTAPDRTVGIDILGTVVVGFCALLSLVTHQEYLMNVALLWALVSFIGTLALAKHLEGRQSDE